MPILQINFKLNVAPAEYRKLCKSVAQTIADVPGLLWKVWLLNEQDGEAGGIYPGRTIAYRLSRLPDYRLRASHSCAKSAPSGSRQYRK